MTQNWLLFACGFAVLTCGLVSGVFLAFSDFVMKSLAATTPASGIESMQVINRKVYGSIFLVLVLGSAALCLLLSGYAFLRISDSVAAWIIAGGVIYLVGVFLVTIVFNVPMNERLDVMDAYSPETVSYWATYLTSWTYWNHIRTISSIGSTICLLVSCILLGRGMHA